MVFGISIPIPILHNGVTEILIVLTGSVISLLVLLFYTYYYIVLSALSIIQTQVQHEEMGCQSHKTCDLSQKPVDYPSSNLRVIENAGFCDIAVICGNYFSSK